MQAWLRFPGRLMRLLINTAIAALFSLGLLSVLTEVYRRRSSERRGFTREFLFGILAAMLVLFVRALLSGSAALPIFAASIFVGTAALTEETGKLAALVVSCTGRAPIDVREGVAAGAALGLGFALVESSWYIADATLPLLFRGVTAVPLHAVAAGLLGWGLESPARASRLLPAYLGAVLLHGVYNAMIAAGGLLAPATVVLIGVAGAILVAITPGTE